MKMFVFCVILFVVFDLAIVWACLKASSEPEPFNNIDYEAEADLLREAMEEEEW